MENSKKNKSEKKEKKKEQKRQKSSANTIRIHIKTEEGWKKEITNIKKYSKAN